MLLVSTEIRYDLVHYSFHLHSSRVGTILSFAILEPVHQLHVDHGSTKVVGVTQIREDLIASSGGRLTLSQGSYVGIVIIV